MKCCRCGIALPDDAKSCPICGFDLVVPRKKFAEKASPCMARFSQILGLLGVSANALLWATLAHFDMGTSIGLIFTWKFCLAKFPDMLWVQIVFGILVFIPFFLAHSSYFCLSNGDRKGVYLTIATHIFNVMWFIAYQFVCEFITIGTSPMHSSIGVIAVTYFVLSAVPCVVLACSSDYQ